MRKINTLYIHAADTPASMDIGVEEIRVWHTAPPPRGNGWRDIGYHYVIRRSGKIETGRDLDGDGNIDEEIGAHVKGFNSHSIGICLVGGKPDFNFTFLQLSALIFLVGELCRRYSIPMENVLGHRDSDPSKTCPCFDVKSLFKGMTPKEIKL